ncbi:uncharacterized protein BDR25DRAFT_320419 [Lindgomyces ingoldianus]|uniref:Uncharacterized protein n=1 Tax=Lindgomyces ingoldianus TaxID=673940 RepID=A0ACB6Q7P7_9PLEO|nr:uncharacterized protein BDR25DRAFT_320419 [Lindgomyces ingoldianus]KAF2462866.1 hypothetical protein BDR25DRAFT_320419 [Lindgomyces ingoldianus]
MWGLTPIRRRITTTRNTSSHSVSGPAEFIKLARDHLDLPYIYFKRALLQAVATGASFDVRFFDIDPGNIGPDIKQRVGTSSQLKKGQWLVAKHIAPVIPEDLELIAVKDTNSDGVRLGSMVQEMRILAHKPFLSHPNIVNLLGFSWERNKDELGRRWPVLIMEAADGGSLKDFLELADSSIKSPAFALSIALDIASGLEALHSCGVIHGDLKPDNILVFQVSKDTFRAKISDFGFACLTEDLKSEAPDDLAQHVSLPGFSPPWEAPEAGGDILLTNLSKVDVYGFGLLACYLAASGEDIFADLRLDTSDRTFDFDRITSLKNDTQAMTQQAKQFVTSWLDIQSMEWNCFARIIDLTLNSSPKDRADISKIRILLSTTGDDAERTLAHYAPVPLLPLDDPSSDEHVQYQYLASWNRDLMMAASDDIVSNWSTRSISEINSADCIAVERGAQRLFWLSRALISGLLGPDSKSIALDWLFQSANAGSTEAKASVHRLFSALKEPIPIDSLYNWLVDACYGGEELAEYSLKELYPKMYPGVLEILKTTYCGYGQDCFGEQWRNEYPLGYLDDIVEDSLEEGQNIDKLHDYPGLVCGMTWLHYAASNGRFDTVQLLINKGADPNVTNEYGETPLFMACQAGHFEVAVLLFPVTQNRPESWDDFAANELHHLVRFDQDRIGEAAKMLLEWGANINQQNGDRQQTPLAFILNQHGLNCVEAAKKLLSLGADPLIKDYHGLDCLAHASCQLSSDLVELVLHYVPPEMLVQRKTDALWFVLEMDNYEVLVNGGEHYVDKLEKTVKLLIDKETSCSFQDITGHSVLTFACAKASLAVVQCLAKLIPNYQFTEWRPSTEEWYTPLMAAVVRNRTEIVEYLLELGVDPCVSHQNNQWTPLFYAVSGSPQIVRALVQFVERTCSLDAATEYVNKRDETESTAFDIAVAGEFFDAANVLAAYQPDFLVYRFPYSLDSTCLFNSLGLAVEKRYQLFYLLDLMGPVDEPPKVDNEGVTVLHCVCGVPIERAPEDEARGIVDTVLARFCNPAWANCLTAAGESPLHFAARFGNIYAIQKLEMIYAGHLEWFLINNKGWNALDEAESRQFQDVSELGYMARAQFRKRTDKVVAYLVKKGVRRNRKYGDFGE